VFFAALTKVVQEQQKVISKLEKSVSVLEKVAQQ
jgi:hypothetical protein